ncbi:MAG: nucleotide exchange factor GrpE, partial [Chloroflexi bacterium]|nr:nucleotide exchange factor GrpE [Chloroflexota bacterium]
LDDFDRALASLPAELRGMTWLEGIFLIQRKLQLVLEQEGVQPLQVVGQPFDPNLHEAVIHEETSQHPDGHIIAEIQKGYKLGDRVLRPALVKVAKNHPESSSTSA